MLENFGKVMARPIALLMFALVSLLAGPAVGQTNPTIRIATTPIDLGAQALYANDLGFFKRAGLDVELSVLTSGSVVASAVSGGSIDIGQANIVALAAAHGNGLPFVIVAPAGYYTSKAPTTQLVVAATSHITSAKELDGKKIDVTALNDLNWVGIQSWLTQNGAMPDSVKYIEVPQSAVCNILTSGRADAGILSEPYLSYALENQCRVLAPTHDAIAKEFLVGAWFSTTAWAQAHPDLVNRFRAVMRETARWANTHHDESSKILEKYMKLTSAPGMKRVPFAETIDRVQVQKLIDMAAKYGALKSTFPAADLLLPDR
jgi:ABC-type nitrate/sulfonate/bicarbonate transport system substrate-binding protein